MVNFKHVWKYAHNEIIMHEGAPSEDLEEAIEEYDQELTEYNTYMHTLVWDLEENSCHAINIELEIEKRKADEEREEEEDERYNAELRQDFEWSRGVSDVYVG